MNEIMKRISGAANTVGAIILAIMFISITIQVVIRMLGGTLTFVDELSGYSAVWVTFLGIGYALREGRHVRVDLITRMVPPYVKAIMFFIGDLACLFFSIIIVWKGFALVSNSFMAERVTVMLEWPVFILQLVMPIGFIIFGIETVVHAIESWKKICLDFHRSSGIDSAM